MRRDDRHVDDPRQVYDAAASDYVDFVGTELGDATEHAVDRAMLAAFVGLVGQPARGRVVADLGCGPGRAAAFLVGDGLEVVGVDVSSAQLAQARHAHPHIPFVQGRLDELPFVDAALAGAVCWYSIIYTPTASLGGVLAELDRALASGGLLLLAFQSGTGEAVVRANAYGSDVALTSYRHDVEDLARRLEGAGFAVDATTQRAPSFEHESTPQAFVLARRR